MVRTDAIAPSHENERHCNGCDADGLHHAQKKFFASKTVEKKKHARDEPDQPSCNADSPRASLNQQMMYLRIISNYDKSCS
jgi:hypothetical protein